eukprot:CAMPEP_0170479952 /NCGR_PEP_ID=MMETSP0208-20121228/968_1 /TAXON_ID=197538 /ORGANISM="Strombidium inclinatum, Strain S3" /LENGTH=135 /DNA_ID=CAMNT_0010752417 /DNA_START=35 /DNA_END=442 /DNA_ORIENTATION=+
MESVEKKSDGQTGSYHWWTSSRAENELATSVLVLLLGLVVVLLHLGVSLLDQGQLDTLALRKGDGGSLAITNDLDVSESGGEGVSGDVLDVSDLVGAGMLLDGLEDTNSANVVSTGEDDGGSVLELDDSGNLEGF